MLDFGAGEFIVVGVVALIAIGPKELPGVLRTIGRSVGKMRRMAGDFQNQFNDAMREMELEEARKKVEEMGQAVSDHMQAATHVDLSSEIPPHQSTSEITADATTTIAEPAPTTQHAASVLGPLPDIHAPSAEALLSQAQSDALSSVAMPDPVLSPSAPHDETHAAQHQTTTHSDTLPTPDQPHGKGA